MHRRAILALAVTLAAGLSALAVPRVAVGAWSNGDSVTVIHARRAGLGLPAVTLRRFAPGNAVTVGDAGAPVVDAGPDAVTRGGQSDLPVPIRKTTGLHDPFIQRDVSKGARRMFPTIQAGPGNFDGIDSDGGRCGCAPSDTNLAVGLHDIVEIVNAAFAVYSKTGSGILPATPINALFYGLGGPCQSRNDGDPIVLYDSGADRWLISQFTTVSPYADCIAVSTTGDPTGSYYRYEFDESSVNFGDYPKLGVWPVQGNNVYALTTNEFAGDSSFVGPELWMLDRSEMLAGKRSAVMVGSRALGPGSNPFLPADADQSSGPEAPEANSPEYFVEYPQQSSGSTAGTVHIYEGRFDAANPAQSTFGPAPGTPPSTSVFNNGFSCGPSNRDCIPQPGSVDTNTTCSNSPAVVCNLDVISDRYMYRLAYRRINGADTLLTNFTVNASNTSVNRAAPQWFELQNPGGTKPALVQQGAYSPDSANRWMGSVDMDREGNVLLGYSVSSSATYPSIRVAGRSPGDPANELGPEVDVFDGAHSQVGVDRWGDYSSMRVDPTDGCTFWYAQEYAGSSDFSWNTRIASFRFPNCDNSATSLQIAAPATSLSGSAAQVTVSIKDAEGYDAGSYLGTVHLSSNDPSAGLPANYTFTAADSGSHTFAVVFRTGGSQSVTATDVGDPSMTATASVNVKAPAKSLAVVAPKTTGRGIPFGIRVVAMGADGKRMGGYTGTVHFSSTDPQAQLPPDYTFTSKDAGAHTFTSAGPFLTGAIRLFGVGHQTIRATDTGTPATAGSAKIYSHIINTYVSKAGDDAGSCLSPHAPCKTINAAIAKASYGGSVFVKAGKYSENVVVDRDLNLIGPSGRASDNIVDGGDSSSTVVIDPGISASIQNLQIQNGNGGNLGAGGGVANFGASLVLRNDIITHNTAPGALGGGVYNDDGNNSVLKIYDSTIIHNTADNQSGPEGATGLGGGIYDRGKLMLIVNSTITDNSAGTDGGIRFRAGPATVLNSTISGNSAVDEPGNSGPATGGGIDDPSINTSQISIGNSIITGNRAVTGSTATPSDCLGSFSTLGHNLIGDGQDGGACSGFTNGGNGDLVGSDSKPLSAKLAAPADNGGMTLTQKPAAGSLAIGAGSTAICDDAATVGARDQRGFIRSGSACDIGAIEANSTGLPKATLKYTGPTSSVHGTNVRFSAKVTSPVDGSAIAGRIVVFTLRGKRCSAPTNGHGVARCVVRPVSGSAEQTSVTVLFRGDSLGPNYRFGPASVVVPFQVG